ncbi:MAG: hypothetical protein QOJ96_1329 [Alphaproteobacteria bacterium]|nr:hypothetical protein [Alphaproteobacteria bacterium]
MMNASRTTSIATVALSGLILAASLAHAQTPAAPKSGPPAAFTVMSPIYGQLVRFSTPSNFVAAFENVNGGSYIREAVLKGETVKAWTQMITVTGAKGVAGNPKVTPQSFAVSMAAGFKKACPDTFAVEPFGAVKLGDQDGFVAVVGCGRIETTADKHGETALIIAVKGSADYYTIQWAERAPSSADKPAIDEAKWKERLGKLKPIQFCPIVPGEAMPYPSCVGKNFQKLTFPSQKT